jgi:hypothetical protein
MKRKAIMFIAAAAAAAITLSAAGCGGGSYSSKPYGSQVAPIGIAAGLASLSRAGNKIDSDD